MQVALESWRSCTGVQLLSCRSRIIYPEKLFCSKKSQEIALGRSHRTLPPIRGKKTGLGNPSEFGAGNAPAPASLEVLQKANKSNRMKESAFRPSCCLLRAVCCWSSARRKTNNPQPLQIQTQEIPQHLPSKIQTFRSLVTQPGKR